MAAWLTEKDAQDYGYDVLDLAQRAAMHAVAPDLQALNRANAELRAQLAGDRGRVLELPLDREVPRWRAINADPRWLQWLAQRHEMTGQSRQRLLDDATAQGDARRIIPLFHGFLAPYDNITLGQQPQQQAGYQRNASGPRVYTQQQITDMSKRRMKGLINDADWARWEHELIAAGREGRIAGALRVGTR